MAQSVVVFEKDPAVADSLAGGLRSHFSVLSVRRTQSHKDLRDNVAQNNPRAIILNIESWPLSAVESLHHDFPDLPIVCTHRVPDEEMWMAALTAGAADMCPSDDVTDVLTSILRNTAH